MSDKRRSSRRHRVRECQLTYRQGGIASLLNLKKKDPYPVGDVSQSGCAFVADREFEKGSKIHVVLDIPAFVKPLKIEAEVMWCQKMKGYEHYFKIGIQFLKMNADDRAKMNRLDHDSMLHHIRRDVKSEDGLE